MFKMISDWWFWTKRDIKRWWKLLIVLLIVASPLMANAQSEMTFRQEINFKQAGIPSQVAGELLLMSLMNKLGENNCKQYRVGVVLINYQKGIMVIEITGVKCGGVK